jgi:hypothetical protein
MIAMLTVKSDMYPHKISQDVGWFGNGSVVMASSWSWNVLVKSSSWSWSWRLVVVLSNWS